MKNAKKQFKQLGLEFIELDDNPNYSISNVRDVIYENADKMVDFDLDLKKCFISKYDADKKINASAALEPNLVKALYKQMKELGWL